MTQLLPPSWPDSIGARAEVPLSWAGESSASYPSCRARLAAAAGAAGWSTGAVGKAEGPPVGDLPSAMG